MCLLSQQLTPWINTPNRMDANSSKRKSKASQATMHSSTTAARTAACTMARLATCLLSSGDVGLVMPLPQMSTRGTTDHAAL